MPEIVNRREWGARLWAKRAPIVRGGQLRGWAIHHNGPPVHTADWFDEAAIVRAVQRYHQDSKGWSDIAYSFVVGQSGTVFEARGWSWDQFANGTDSVAPFTEHDDTEWLTVLCLLGQDDEIVQEPSPAMLASLNWLRNLSVVYGRAGLEVKPHRDWQHKPCPGDTLTAWCRSVDGQPLPTPPALNPEPQPTGDPDMLLIKVQDDPAFLVHSGTAVRWVRDGRELAALQRTVTPVTWTLDEVQKAVDNGLPTVGASPHTAGSAVHWS